MISRKVAGGHGSGFGLYGRPDQECVAGIFRRDHPDWPGLRLGRLRHGIEHTGAIVCLVDSQKDQRGPIFHNQDSRQDQRRDIEKFPLDRLSFQPGASGCPVIKRNRQLSIEDREPSQQGFATYGASMIGSQICQGSGQGVIAKSPNPVGLGRFGIQLIHRRLAGCRS